MAAQRARGAEIVMAMPMPDEPAWAHLNRLALLNNGTASSVVSAWTGTKIYLSDSVGSAMAAASLLAACAGYDVEEYVARHCIGRKLVREEDSLNCNIRGSNYFVGSLLHEQGYLLRGPRIFKVCRICVREELDQHGFAWLKMTHQVAGVCVCALHGQPLDRYHLSFTERVATPQSTQQQWAENTDDACSDSYESPQVQLYHELVHWLWEAKLNNGVELISGFLEGAISGSYDKAIYTALKEIQSSDSTMGWYASNFIGLSDSNLKKKPNVSFYQIALAICCLGVTKNQVIGSLRDASQMSLAGLTDSPFERGIHS